MPVEPDVIVERAIAWAQSHLGQADYATRCLAFVEDAYEQANGIEIFGGDTAHESAVAYEAGQIDVAPPLGAFVFYDCSGTLRDEYKNWGHVGLVLPDGLAIHAWDVVRVDHYLSFASLPVPPGWTAPAYVGWAPVSRILTGHRLRDWSS